MDLTCSSRGMFSCGNTLLLTAAISAALSAAPAAASSADRESGDKSSHDFLWQARQKIYHRSRSIVQCVHTVWVGLLREHRKLALGSTKTGMASKKEQHAKQRLFIEGEE